MGTTSGAPVEGTMVGPYRIVREVGGGGMGVVYEAADDALHRTVALKIISPHLAEDPAFRDRFVREAQALAALDSPQVVHVYAHGEVDGQLYLATQLVPDGDLAAMLQQYAAPPLRVGLDLVAQVASGLADAHEAGMVHRDIKPANILLRRRGTAMDAFLGDFGIARQLHAEGTDHSRTGTVGTPSYMAPELHTGGSAGVASDLYSLGCLLWAVLTGHAPYRGTTEYHVVQAHLEAPVPQLPGTSPLVTDVNRILRTAMAKRAEDRYPTAAAFRDDLRRTRLLPEVAPAPAPSRRTPTLVVGALLGLLLLGGVVAWAVSGGDDEAATTRPGTTPTSEPTPTGTPGQSGLSDRERAVASITEDLTERGVLTPEQARCTAESWVELTGLQRMADEGLLDDDWQFVDVPVTEMTARSRAIAAEATIACIPGT